MPPQSLGVCHQKSGKEGICGGPLCTRGHAGKTVVACERCGNEVPDHPLAKEIASAVKAPPPRAHECQPHEFPATHNDRLIAAEKIVKAQGARILAQEKRIEALEAAVGKMAERKAR